MGGWGGKLFGLLAIMSAFYSWSYVGVDGIKTSQDTEHIEKRMSDKEQNKTAKYESDIEKEVTEDEEK